MFASLQDVEASHKGPQHAAYTASKAALTGFSHACYEALRPHGIKVYIVACMAHGLPRALAASFLCCHCRGSLWLANCTEGQRYRRSVILGLDTPGMRALHGL